MRTLGPWLSAQTPSMAIRLLLVQAYVAPLHADILPLAMQGYAWLAPVHGRYTLLTTCIGHRCTPIYGSLRRHPRPGTPEQAPYWARP